MVVAQKAVVPPFDTQRLDSLMERSGIDVIIATSRHNVQYLLAGYRFFFFETIDAAGINRYLPLVIYWKGRPDRIAYVGSVMEAPERERGSFWPVDKFTGAWDSMQAIEKAITHLKESGYAARRIGVEVSFLPLDAGQALKAAFPDAEIVDAHRPLGAAQGRQETLRTRIDPASV